MKTIEQHLEAIQKRRMAAEDRYLIRYSKREEEAEKLVGEIISQGGMMFYINARNAEGELTGKIVKFSREYDAISYLIRNRYV